MKKKDKPGIILRKERGKPVPVSAFDEEQWQSLPDKTEVDVTERTKRSNPQNRFYFGILANTIEMCGATMPVTSLHHDLKQALGYVTLYRDLDGSLRKEVDSTNFDEMKPHEFRVYFDAAMALLAERVGFDPVAAMPQREAEAA